MEITGKIIFVSPVSTGVSQRTGNTWASREFVVETQEQYPNRACIKLFGQEKIDKHPVNVGDIVTVSFDINASEYNGRWYNQLNAWSITLPGASAPEAQQATGEVPYPQAGLTPPVQAPAQPQGCQVIYQNQPSRSPQGDTSQQRPQASIQQPAADEVTGLPF